MRRRSGWKTVPRGIGVGKADSFRFVSAWRRRFGLVCVEQAARFVIQSSTSRACWRWCDGTRCACVTPARLNVLRSLEDASRCVDGFIKSVEKCTIWMDATRRIAYMHPSVRLSLSLVPFTRVSGSITRIECPPTCAPPLFDFISTDVRCIHPL